MPFSAGGRRLRRAKRLQSYPLCYAEGEPAMYRILIVEDDEVIAGVVRRHLESWGLSGGLRPAL